MPTVDTWDPVQYERFAAERRQPFDDLLGLVEPVPGGRVVDLGCGSGDLTVELHRHTAAAHTLGIDSSPAMLTDAPRVEGLTFAVDDLRTWTSDEPLDIVFANASLQWSGGHEDLLARLVGQLAPGGQLAVQVPCNHDHPSHTASAAVAAGLLADPPADPVAVNVLAPARYAEVLHELGAERQHVRMQVYGHLLDSTADVVEWTKGTSLTRFRTVLDDAAFADLVDRYRTRLVAELGDRRPYFYAFKRILF
ncbi:MAG: trans-aconitate 2-methyltransferase, partial [Actinomycetota bacterium]|nr:trans-aconitate 2-methyltransferase [Actinomycetota bacterium]